MSGKKILLVSLLTTFSIHLAHASITIPIVLFKDNGQSENIGTITAQDSSCGVLLTPNLHGLPQGTHGFHVHVNPSCDENGMAAGGHLDPANTTQHHGPYSDNGHLGDLPVLIVGADGKANLPTLAPRFKLSQIMGHSIMIHAGSDNYSDTPEKLGGGGVRIACGIIGENKP
jgi:Cu-Zn family superoxide dismutase